MYKRVKVPGDGSCFYHSVLMQLKHPVQVGSIKFSPTVETLRNMVASILTTALNNAHSEYHSLLLYYAEEQNMSPKKYIAQTRKCMWAGPLEIQIVANILKVRIQVYNYAHIMKHKQRNTYNIKHAKPIVDLGDRRRRTIKTVIYGYNPQNEQYGTHYDALVKQS